MVNNCCVVGCSNYVGKKKGIRLFRFPLANKERCSRWKAAVRRADWEPSLHTRICNEHFQSGKPVDHPSHPDYVPSVFPEKYRRSTSRQPEKISRLRRHVENQVRRQAAQDIEEESLRLDRERKEKEEAIRRKEETIWKKEEERKKREAEAEKKRIDRMNERIEKQRAMQIEREKRAEQRQNARREREKAKEEMMRVRKQKEEEERMRQEQQEEERRQVQAEITEMEEERKRVEMKRTELELESYRLGERIQQLKAAECERPIYLSTVSHQQQQTDENSTTMRQLVDENSELKSRLAMICTVALICDDDARCAFYTGMSWIVFQHVFNFLSPHVSQSNSLSLEDEFCLF